MSLVNLSISAHEALIVTDTVTYRLGGGAADLGRGKCHVSSNGRYAVALRGVVAFSDWLGIPSAGGWYMSEPLWLAEHGLYALPPSVLEQADASAAAEVFRLSVPRAPSDLLSADRIPVEAFIVGPGANGEIVAHHGQLIDGVVQMEIIPPSICLRPGLGPKASGLPKWADAAQLVKLAQLQHRVQESFEAPLCLGGALHLTRVTGDGVSCEVVGVLPDYDALAARFQDPLAAEVAAWRAGAQGAAQ